MRSTLTISIATKDRHEVLNETLKQIHAFGLGACPLILCDDGSTPALAPAALALFPNHRIIRHEQGTGQAIGRNEIVAACNTPYVLQLDDDSYPLAGSVEQLLELADSEDNWLAIALPFEEPARGRGFPEGIPEFEPIQVKAFVGCSVLIHVENFRKLGGYADWVGRMGEEEELCLRALDAKVKCLSIDKIRIRHEVSDKNRNLSKITRLCLKNWTLICILHAPSQILPWRLIRLIVGAVLLGLRQRRLDALKGVVDGFRRTPDLLFLRKPVSLSTYRAFSRLPHALDFFEKSES